jgi:hypothetical protein
LADDPDFEHIMIAATIVRTHHTQPAQKGGSKAWPSAARAVD